MSGGVIILPAIGAVMVAAGACVGAAYLVYKTGQLAVKGLAKGGSLVKKTGIAAKEKVNEKIEHKREQVLSAIDAESQRTLNAMLSGLDNLKSAIHRTLEDAERYRSKLEQSQHSTHEKRQSFLKQEAHYVDQLITGDMKDDAKIAAVLGDIRKTQSSYANAWKEINADYLSAVREDAKLSALRGIITGMVADLRAGAGGDKDLLTKVSAAERDLEAGRVGEAYERACSLIEGVRSRTTDVQFKETLENMEEINRLSEVVVLRSFERAEWLKRERELLNNLLVKKDFLALTSASDKLVKDLRASLARLETAEYLEFDKKYVELLNRYFYVEDPFELDEDSVLNDKLEELALALDSGEYQLFQTICDEIESRISSSGQEFISNSALEVMQEQGFEDARIEIDEDEKVSKIRGAKGDRWMMMWVDSTSRIMVDFDEGAMENDQECHKVLSDFVLALRQKLLDKNFEINFLELITKWRTDETICMVIQEEMSEESTNDARKESQSTAQGTRVGARGRIVT